jgi:hypothetical protein
MNETETVPCGNKHSHGNKNPQLNSETQAT